MQSSTGALRYNDIKPKWGLVDFDALENMVRVLEYGEKKYDAHNWKKGLPYTSTIESMLRHIYAFLAGEDIDPESGLPHTGHIMCNAMFLDYYYQYCKDMDDRFIDTKKKKNLCKGTNSKGEPCILQATSSDGYCGYHVPMDIYNIVPKSINDFIEDEKKENSTNEEQTSS